MNAKYKSQVTRVLLWTLVLNLFVMFLKGGLGLWTGSLSLLADALHSFTDSANNVLGLVTSRLSSPEPDRDHPYGHQKFEAVGALGIAAFLGIACFEILESALTRFLEGGQEISVSGVELWLLLIVLGVNIFVAFYERSVGQQLNSPILIADAKHTMSDVWITITVMAGLIGIWIWNYQWLDLILSLPVAILVFLSGWSVIKTNLPWLVDAMAIAPEAIHAVVMQVPGVVNCHNIASRGVVGQRIFIEMHLIVASNEVDTAHQITEQVEAKLFAQYGPVRATIHVEPPDYESAELSYGELKANDDHSV